MRIINNLKNRKFIKRIFKKRNYKLLDNKINTDNIVNNELLNDKVDNLISILPSNETILIDNREKYSNYQKDLSNPINHIHSEGQCICLFFLLILYYSSVIFTKMKRNFK